MRCTALAAAVAENSLRFLGHDTHEHEDPHLVFIVAGSATLTAAGQEATLRRHESAWLQPGVPHSMRIHEGGMALGPMLGLDASPPSPLYLLGVVPAVVDIMTASMVAAPANSEQVQPFRRALGQVLRSVSIPYFAVAHPSHPAAQRLAREATRSSATLEELAQRHQLSPRQVQRIFLSEVGLTFSSWRARARMNHAVSMLLAGDAVQGAARAAGFATRSGFVRALSRETGIPVDALSRDPRAALTPEAPQRASA